MQKVIAAQELCGGGTAVLRRKLPLQAHVLQSKSTTYFT